MGGWQHNFFQGLGGVDNNITEAENKIEQLEQEVGSILPKIFYKISKNNITFTKDQQQFGNLYRYSANIPFSQIDEHINAFVSAIITVPSAPKKYLFDYYADYRSRNAVLILYSNEGNLINEIKKLFFDLFYTKNS